MAQHRHATQRRAGVGGIQRAHSIAPAGPASDAAGSAPLVHGVHRPTGQAPGAGARRRLAVLQVRFDDLVDVGLVDKVYQVSSG
jgi:hypothetical protein